MILGYKLNKLSNVSKAHCTNTKAFIVICDKMKEGNTLENVLYKRQI